MTRHHLSLVDQTPRSELEHRVPKRHLQAGARDVTDHLL
ncbi:MAG: hypothetical protein QOH48_1043 [Actinomycetota bacterium]|jgi:hypothetical protein|nr:hypothetical protein [Actinomycetota bacterium]